MRPHSSLRVALLFAALVSSASACNRSAASQSAAPAAADAKPIPVQTVKAIERSVPTVLAFTGSLRAHQESEVAADASGKVLKTFVERGDAVKQGQTIAILDARSATIGKSYASAQEKAAEAQLELARSDCQRGQQLFDSGSISKAEFDRTMAQCTANQYQAKAATANLESATKALGDAIIKAPFSGIVGERFVNVGQYVQPQTRVASVYAVDPLRLELTVPEAQVALVQKDMPIEFTVAAFGAQAFVGKVRYISPIIRRDSRDLVVEAVVPNPEGKLRPGMFATVRIAVGESRAPALPVTAVNREGSVPRIFAVVDGRAEERVVQLGDERDGQLVVLRGVKVGDSVVDKPSAEVRDGVKLETK
jgi:membrane fusion protein (multidrug efflux system)